MKRTSLVKKMRAAATLVLVATMLPVGAIEPGPEELRLAAADVPVEAVASERTETVDVTDAAATDKPPAPQPPAGMTDAQAATEGLTAEGDVGLPDPDDGSLLAASPDLLNPPGLEVEPIDPGPLPSPSHSVTINLINRLVERGVLTKEDSAELIAQAEADAEIARARDEAASEAIAATNEAAQDLLANTPPPPSDDSVRVTYIPSFVRTQIRDEVKEEVLLHAREENWLGATALPPWVLNVKPFADFRFRYEGIYFPSGNDDTGVFPNFDAINTGDPFDVTGDQFSPQLNVNENRYRLRVRVRLGAEINLGEGFTMGVRLATGDSNSPTSTNQTLGRPDGNFNKYAIWLDRGFLQYTLAQDVDRELSASVGRFDNPFFRASQIMWDNDIGFDGVALQGRYDVGWGFTPFFAGGVFPVYNSSFNFASNQPSKYASYDKWLYGIQGGLDWDVTKHVNVTTALGYFYFDNIEGVLSDPYVPLSADDAGNTDESRPLFAQKGNTYRPIRNIIPTEANNFGTINQYQYYGLATKFQNLAFSGEVSFTFFEPVVITIGGEYVNNLAFNSGDINEIAVNNRGTVDPDNLDDVGDFIGGDSAWIVQIEAGTAALANRWDWNVAFGYRYVESDAVVDGFNDSNFGGGGTNLKGWTASASVAISSNVWLTASYLSGRSIAGPQFSQDIFQFDINARF